MCLLEVLPDCGFHARSYVHDTKHLVGSSEPGAISGSLGVPTGLSLRFMAAEVCGWGWGRMWGQGLSEATLSEAQLSHL